MKILFVSDTYYPHINGVYYFVCRLGRLLQEKGHQVAIIAPSESINYAKKKIDGLDVYLMPSLPLRRYRTIRLPSIMLLRIRIHRIIQEFGPDIIHIQDHFLLCRAAIKLGRDLKIPVIGTNHFMAVNITAFVHGKHLKHGLENFLWHDFSRVYNQVRIVTTPTEAGASLIRHRLKVDVIAISCGINLETFNPFGDPGEVRKKYGIPDKHVLLYVGRIDPEKRIEEILEAVVLAAGKADFCFVVVGKGTSKAYLEQLSHKLGITDRVIFTGFVPDEELPYVYKLSRCFIIASIAELLSLVTLQAMASGLPVIAVNEGALGELVKDNENGFLYSQGDIPAIVKSITDIISEDDLHRRMSARSLEIVRHHDIFKILDTYEKLYQQYSKT